MVCTSLLGGGEGFFSSSNVIVKNVFLFESEYCCVVNSFFFYESPWFYFSFLSKEIKFNTHTHNQITTRYTV